MPGSTAFGLRASLATASCRALPEISSITTYPSNQFLCHPLYTCTVVTPASTKQVPFSIRLDFDPVLDLPEYLKGDMRIEVQIDGQLAALRILKHEKVRPVRETFSLELSGLRCGRTEERAFVFVPLPPGSDFELENTKESAEESPEGKVEQKVPEPYGYKPLVDNISGNRNPDILEPPYPVSNLPPNASHIQILISLGKKYHTLEKYLFSPIHQHAFYTRPDPTFSLDPNKWVPAGNSLKARQSKRPQKGSKTLSGAGTRSLTPFASASANVGSDCDGERGSDDDDIVWMGGGKAWKKGEMKDWKPVGLAPVAQKTVQTKEVEFSARMHMVRFWFVIIPTTNPIYKIPQVSAQPTDFNSPVTSTRKTLEAPRSPSRRRTPARVRFRIPQKQSTPQVITASRIAGKQLPQPLPQIGEEEMRRDVPLGGSKVLNEPLNEQNESLEETLNENAASIAMAPATSSSTSSSTAYKHPQRSNTVGSEGCLPELDPYELPPAPLLQHSELAANNSSATPPYVDLSTAYQEPSPQRPIVASYSSSTLKPVDSEAKSSDAGGNGKENVNGSKVNFEGSPFTNGSSVLDNVLSQRHKQDRGQSHRFQKNSPFASENNQDQESTKLPQAFTTNLSKGLFISEIPSTSHGSPNQIEAPGVHRNEELIHLMEVGGDGEEEGESEEDGNEGVAEDSEDPEATETDEELGELICRKQLYHMASGDLENEDKDSVGIDEADDESVQPSSLIVEDRSDNESVEPTPQLGQYAISQAIISRSPGFRKFSRGTSSATEGHNIGTGDDGKQAGKAHKEIVRNRGVKKSVISSNSLAKITRDKSIESSLSSVPDGTERTLSPMPQKRTLRSVSAIRSNDTKLGSLDRRSESISVAVEKTMSQMLRAVSEDVKTFQNSEPAGNQRADADRLWSKSLPSFEVVIPVRKRVFHGPGNVDVLNAVNKSPVSDSKRKFQSCYEVEDDDGGVEDLAVKRRRSSSPVKKLVRRGRGRPRKKRVPPDFEVANYEQKKSAIAPNTPVKNRLRSWPGLGGAITSKGDNSKEEKEVAEDEVVEAAKNEETQPVKKRVTKNGGEAAVGPGRYELRKRSQPPQ